MRTIYPALAVPRASIASACRAWRNRVEMPLMVVFFSVAVAAGPLFGAPPTKNAAEDLQKLTAKELIDKLPDESDEAVRAWVGWNHFMLMDEKPPLRADQQDIELPNASRAVRELIRRGVESMPSLLDHLGDNRPTKCTVEHPGGFGGMWHSDEYRPRYPDPKKSPPNVNTRLTNSRTGFDKEGRGKRYTLRVGDVCALMVGLIVNRPLSVARGQPTMCTVINSPVQTSALAAAIKADWAGLTSEQHRLSLTEDAFKKDLNNAAGKAVSRLLFYYPKEGEELALKLLARPLYDRHVGWDFVDRLCKVDDPAKQKELLDEFRERHGEAAADALPFLMRWNYWEAHIQRTSEFLAERSRAEKILARFFPMYDPYRPPFINAVEPSEQRDFIESTSRFPSARLDGAVFQVFRTAAEMEAEMGAEQRDCYWLAMACASRLVGKGHDDLFDKYVTAHIRAIELRPQDDRDGWLLEGLQKLQKRLK